MSQQMFAELGKELARQLVDESIEDRVDGAKAMLDDDNLVGFQLVAIRDSDDGLEGGMARAIDPEVVIESDDPGDIVVEDLHSAMCDVYDRQVREQ